MASNRSIVCPVAVLAGTIAVLAGLSSPAHADALVLQSSLRSAPAGQIIVAGGRLNVPAGARVTLLMADGTVQRLVGPVRHTEAAAVPRAGMFDAVRAMVQARDDPQRLGGVRGDDAPACRQTVHDWVQIADLWKGGCRAAALQHLDQQLAAAPD
jgi:hypothetical protein